MLIYVSGKYSGDVDANIEAAASIAGDLWEMGHAVFCPHTNTANFEKRCAATYEQYIAGDLEVITWCGALVMVPGWEESKGAVIEKDYAESLGIPIYYAPDYPPLHPTEINYPEQAKAFREILGQMYRTHLKKNADYSPNNITLTGDIGVVTRLWDKMARLLTLHGLKFTVAQGTWGAVDDPKNEPVEDSFLDMAVHAIIGLILRRGHWGR